MPIQVLMPALSPTMEKGNLAKWLKKEGDAVKTGDVIAEIETDKATMEVEAIDNGTLGKILVPEGTNDIAVNTPIATIVAEGEDKSALARTAPAPTGDGKAAAPAQAKETTTPPAATEPAKAQAPAQPKTAFAEPDVLEAMKELEAYPSLLEHFPKRSEHDIAHAAWTACHHAGGTI